MHGPDDPAFPPAGPPASAPASPTGSDATEVAGNPDRDRDPRREEAVLPVVEERLVVGKTARDSIVRVSTRTRSEDVDVDETLVSLKADVKRVSVERFVDEVPAIEERDGVTVIPVVEEVLVKRLLLREELHVTQVREERHHRETVTLRTQDPVVERLPSDASEEPSPPSGT